MPTRRHRTNLLRAGAVALSAALIAFPRLTAARPENSGWAVPQETPPRMVGDVTRDGDIRASDALAVLVHVVGKELPPHFRVDPDGDVACRGNNVRAVGENPPHPIHQLTTPNVTALDALWILSSVVGKDLPGGTWPGGHCLGFVNRPDYRVFLDPPGDTLVTVEGRNRYEWVWVQDTLTGETPWDNQVNTITTPEAALAGLIRTRSDDPTVARIDTIQEWTYALAQFHAASPGETKVYAQWFDTEDTVHVIVHPWVPTYVTMNIRSIFRLGQNLIDQGVVGDTTWVTATAHDTLGFSKGLGHDSIQWSSTNPAVASIDAGGVIRALSPGTTDIQVSWGALSVSRTFSVLSSADAVEQDVAFSFFSWWNGNHRRAPGPLLSVAADQHTSSWGNFGMRDGGSEPRMAWNNDPSYGNRYATEDPWFYLHGSLEATSHALSDIDGGLQFGAGGADTERARAFAKFTQGLSLGSLALLFDQAFILTENDLTPSQLSPYGDVMAAAISSLNAGIALANANSFTTPDSWMTKAHTSAELVQMMHSYIARFMAWVPRTPADRASVDWTTVVSHIGQGITSDFSVFGNNDQWYDYLKTYTTFSGWGRVDMRTLGPADQSGAFQAWMAAPVDQRTEFLVDTDDRRVTGGAAESNGLYFGYMGPSPFPANRGTYHFSVYGSTRYDDYSSDWIGDMVDMTVAEMDFLRAEAAYRVGDYAGALALINPYRTTNGQLPAATADGATGACCTPRMPDGSCGDLWETIKYEKRLEVFHTALGDAFYDDRGWGDLVEKTYYHLPVPGQVLVDLGLPIYTFGGDQPLMGSPAGLSLDPERVQRHLAAIRAWVAERRAETREVPTPR